MSEFVMIRDLMLHTELRVINMYKMFRDFIMNIT